MELISFNLKPFESTNKTDAIAIGGTVVRKENQLSIQYLLSGDLSNVEIAPLSSSNQRRNRLWEKTCFEYFLRPADPQVSHYWEFNLSPSGDWNVFSLSGYRDGLQAEQAIATLPFTTQHTAKGLQLNLSINIAPLLSNQDALIGISTVLIIAGRESYWAIAHPAPQADFHHPNSFVLPLPS